MSESEDEEAAMAASTVGDDEDEEEEEGDEGEIEGDEGEIEGDEGENEGENEGDEGENDGDEREEGEEEENEGEEGKEEENEGEEGAEAKTNETASSSSLNRHHVDAPPPLKLTRDERNRIVLPAKGEGKKFQAALRERRIGASLGSVGYFLERGNEAYLKQQGGSSLRDGGSLASRSGFQDITVLRTALEYYKRALGYCERGVAGDEAYLETAVLLNAGEVGLQLRAAQAEAEAQRALQQAELKRTSSSAAVGLRSSGAFRQASVGASAKSATTSLRTTGELADVARASASADALAKLTLDEEGQLYVERALNKIDIGLSEAEVEACLLFVLPDARSWWTPLKEAFMTKEKKKKSKGKGKGKGAKKGGKKKAKKKAA